MMDSTLLGPGSGSSNEQHRIMQATTTRKVCCIFCTDAVAPEDLNGDEAHGENLKLRKMLRALYSHIDFLNPKDVPQNCTGEMFPFCTMCKRLVENIYRNQCLIEEAQKNIANDMESIEGLVSEGELLKPKSIVKVERRESDKLVDKIMDGIRCKLLMKKAKRKMSMGMRNVAVAPRSSVTSEDHNNGIQGQFSSTSGVNEGSVFLNSNGVTQTADNTTTNLHMVEPMTVEVNPDTVCLQREEAQTSCIVAEYNEASCSMVISNVRSTSEDRITGTGGDPDIIVVKQEQGFPPPGSMERRRILIGGVSVWRIADPIGSQSLQCGKCDFVVPLIDRNTMEDAPYEKMRLHISTEHFQQTSSDRFQTGINGVARARRRGRPRKEDTPIEPTTSWYDKYAKIWPCDICGKPVRGTKMSLLSHKFSHKNDQERKIAVAAGEVGARPNKLGRGRVKQNSLQQIKRSKPRAVRARKKHRENNFVYWDTSNPAEFTVSNDKNEWTCEVCFRVLKKQNYYTMHMKKHFRDQQRRKVFGSHGSQMVPPSVQTPPLQMPSTSVSMRVTPPVPVFEKPIVQTTDNGEEKVIGYKVASQRREPNENELFVNVENFCETIMQT